MTQTKINTTCPYCGVGCGVAIHHNQIVGDSLHPANYGALCVKGAALAESLQMPSRLLYPRIAGDEVSWQQATDHIAEQFYQAIQQYGPDSVAMYVSGQLLTEDYYAANKLMKGYVGSANIDTNSRLCMSSAVAAHIRSFGEDVVPVNYEDIDHTDLLVLVGANSAWTHPVLFRRIQQAREDNPHLKLVVIDPRKTITAEQADLHLAINNDGDVLLFNGLLRYLMDNHALDEAYISAHTQGFEQLAAELRLERYQVKQVAQDLEITPSALETFYHWFCCSPSALTLFCQGVNQSESGVDKGNAIINVHLASGKIGKAGSGPFSLTGQPNAMGGREVGGLANQLAVHRGFDAESLTLVQEYWQSPTIAAKPGLKAVELFQAVERGEVKVLWIMATNPVISMPESDHIRRALTKCDCVIVSDISADSDVAAYADVLLPAAGWGEDQASCLFAKVALDEGLKGKQLFMSMHWAGRYSEQSQVNRAIGQQCDPISGQPAFKSALVHLAAAQMYSYGIYVGDRRTLPECDYQSYQQEQDCGVSRFASLTELSKAQFVVNAGEQVLRWDLPQGWMMIIGRSSANESAMKVTGIVLVSPQPITQDYTMMVALIGQPLQLSSVLTLAQGQQTSRLICSCFRITDQQIHQAIEQEGCVSLNHLQQRLKCGTNCGSCVPEIRQLLNEHENLTMDKNVGVKS